ncbi:MULTISPECIES: ANTAR domain-containing protein [Mycobacteriaceae]|uniref:ANTAR domain-containing protein n=1 Tax=Mycolicibacterium austroafricanum TaxID=39687 RepID=A0ABT8H904_MYCAO|nr:MULTISPECIES: ANTAR domain-containing protein [Mycobacteriaceae]MDN4517244.1 ANTAR domain-containing protein [Mycolicibacterium austroafricanum]
MLVEVIARPSHGASAALNLLARSPRAFSAEAEALGAMLATHAAIALSVVNKEQQFESALASRDAIGQAKGILMERFGIDAVGALELLKKLSQDSNTAIPVIAERLISSLHGERSRSSGSARTTRPRRGG